MPAWEKARERQPGEVPEQELTEAHHAASCPAGDAAQGCERSGSRKTHDAEAWFPSPPAFRSASPQSSPDVPGTWYTGASQPLCELLESHAYTTACAQQNGSLGAEE